ncbi:MAG: hypothetical protein IH968_19180 [Gemmatimonadetes bacterium]|nr:hypothetical protein [Gemmatimonadota bacterium]
MNPIHPVRSLLPALALTLGLASCGPEAPSIMVYVSEPVSICGEDGSAAECDEFAAHEFSPERLTMSVLSGTDTEALDSISGIEWTVHRAPEEDLFLNLRAIHGSDRRESAAYVLEIVNSGVSHDTLLSLGSNDGASVWVNGRQIMRSRFRRRPLRRHEDLVQISLTRGPNLILYRILQGDGPWALLRNWVSPTDQQAIHHALAVGAFGDLPQANILPDTSRGVELKTRSVRIPGRFNTLFKWKTLLGDVLSEAEDPEDRWLPFPPQFDGGAMLEALTLDVVSGDTVFVDEVPVLYRSWAEESASALLHEAGDAGDDPVLQARLDLVRKAFSIGTTRSSYPDWLRARAVVDLLRRVRDPGGYHEFPGPQVWGYRSESDDTVQPFWLMVPAGRRLHAGETLPAVISMNHNVRDDFWRGRGGQAGFVKNAAFQATAHGVLGIIPHFRGSQEFAEVAIEELPELIGALRERYTVDGQRLGVLAWSQHAVSAVLLAMTHPEMISHLGLAVPFFGDQATPELEAIFELLYQARPDLRWLLWGGEDDDLVTPAEVGRLTDLIAEAGFEVSWTNVPHASHLEGMLLNVEALLFHATSGAPATLDEP